MDLRVRIPGRRRAGGVTSAPKAPPTLGSLCTGYGGLDLAVEHVTGARLAWYADNDPAASRVLAARYPHTHNLGDISTVDWTNVERVDIITAGFPRGRCPPGAPNRQSRLTESRVPQCRQGP